MGKNKLRHSCFSVHRNHLNQCFHTESTLGFNKRRGDVSKSRVDNMAFILTLNAYRCAPLHHTCMEHGGVQVCSLLSQSTPATPLHPPTTAVTASSRPQPLPGSEPEKPQRQLRNADRTRWSCAANYCWPPTGWRESLLEWPADRNSALLPLHSFPGSQGGAKKPCLRCPSRRLSPMLQQGPPQSAWCGFW